MNRWQQACLCLSCRCFTRATSRSRILPSLGDSPRTISSEAYYWRRSNSAEVRLTPHWGGSLCVWECYCYGFCGTRRAICGERIQAVKAPSSSPHVISTRMLLEPFDHSAWVRSSVSAKLHYTDTGYGEASKSSSSSFELSFELLDFLPDAMTQG